jgi:hypothetical protein
MNRRMMIAALTAVGAVSFAVGSSQAQQRSALDTKIGAEAPAPRAGALPMPALKLGQKGESTEQTAQATTSGASARKLEMAPQVDVPIENK